MTATSVPAARTWPEISRSVWGIGLGIATAVLYVVFRGQFTLPHDDDAPLFQALNDLREFVDDNRDAPILASGLTSIRVVVFEVVEFFMNAFAALTWPGVIALGGLLGFLVGGWRYAALMIGGFGAAGAMLRRRRSAVA